VFEKPKNKRKRYINKRRWCKKLLRDARDGDKYAKDCLQKYFKIKVTIHDC